MIAPRPPADSPLPREVLIELRRVVERWQQLPLDRALPYAGHVRALAQHLADLVATSSPRPSGASGSPAPAELLGSGGTGTAKPQQLRGQERPIGIGVEPLPDLGPAVLMDQLTVTVYDACVAGLHAGLAERLARLRRELA